MINFIGFVAKPDLMKSDPGENVTMTWHPNRRFDPTVSGSEFIIVHDGVDILHYNEVECYRYAAGNDYDGVHEVTGLPLSTISDAAENDYDCVYEDNGLSLGVTISDVNDSHAGDYGIRITYSSYDDVLTNNDAQLYVFRKFNKSAH